MNGTLSRILYVEEEADIHTVAQLALETVGGFTLKVCGSGDEAVEVGPAFAPDLILLDVMMPGMDGPTARAALREERVLQQTPVIFITAKAQPNELQRYRDLGARDVIAKPFDPLTLAEKVRSIWERADG